MMLIPYRLETVYTRLPYVNGTLIAINTLVFFLIIFGGIALEDAESLILRDWDLSQMIGSTFLHADFFHLLGNIAYPFLYLFLGLCASLAHMTFSGEPALGASGAINGVVGLSLVLFPVNRLHCWYCFSLPFVGILWKSGRFKVRAYWMIIAWAVFDVIGLITGGDNIGHWAHLGGFATGLLTGFALLSFKAIETYDPTLLDVLAGRPLERTDYDLNQLAAMALPGTATPVRTLNGSSAALTQTRAGSKPPAPLNPPQAHPHPVFRVTNILQKGNDLLIFFMNEGDPVNGISLVTSDGLQGSLQPTFRIGKREMGTLRLANCFESALPTVDLSVSFSAGSQKETKRLIYDEATKTFRVD